MYCEFCQKQGRIEEKCWKKHGKPDWAAKEETTPTAPTPSNALVAECSIPSAPSSITLSHDDFEHLLKMAHGDSSLPSVASAKSRITNNSTSYSHPWLIDSGATVHMTSTAYLFFTYSSFKTPILVGLADGSKVPAVGKGNVLINPNLKLTDVLLVPSFLMNLLSVKKLCSNGSYHVIFTSACCIFRKQGAGKRLVVVGVMESFITCTLIQTSHHMLVLELHNLLLLSGMLG